MASVYTEGGKNSLPYFSSPGTFLSKWKPPQNKQFQLPIHGEQKVAASLKYR